MPTAQSQQALNRLSREKSPYLLQHAENPVDWLPWSDEAFAEAKSRDKPIFLCPGSDLLGGNRGSSSAFEVLLLVLRFVQA